MGHMSDKDREFAVCEECGKVYPANIASEGDIIPMGVSECRDCGGTEFTLLGDEADQEFAAED